MNAIVDESLINMQASMEKAANKMKAEFSTIRAGRANPHILDRVFVDCYGTRTPIQQTANINVADARTLIVSPWDISLVKSISASITEANLGVSVGDDGKLIRLSFPILTEERRKDFVKEIKKILEDCKIALRSCRKDTLDVLKNMKKESEISEDEYDRADKQVQKEVDEFSLKADGFAEKKIAEVMEI